MNDAAISEQDFYGKFSSRARVQTEKENRGGTKPYETERRMRRHFSIIAITFLAKCYQTFCENEMEGDSKEREDLMRTRNGTIKSWINIGFREHNICFQWPDNSHYQIALMIHSFTDFTFNWPGSAYNRYTRWKKTLEAPSQMFCSISPLEVLRGRNKNDENCKGEELFQLKKENDLYQDYGYSDSSVEVDFLNDTNR